MYVVLLVMPFPRQVYVTSPVDSSNAGHYQRKVAPIVDAIGPSTS